MNGRVDVIVFVEFTMWPFHERVPRHQHHYACECACTLSPMNINDAVAAVANADELSGAFSHQTSLISHPGKRMSLRIYVISLRGQRLVLADSHRGCKSGMRLLLLFSIRYKKSICRSNRSLDWFSERNNWRSLVFIGVMN
ncbi:hypothetical protein V3C99_006514 [Haemonchus contortus]